MAPEIVSKKPYYGLPTDMWACGILCYALLCGTFPFKAMSDKELYRKIMNGQIIYPDFVSMSARNFL